MRRSATASRWQRATSSEREPSSWATPRTETSTPSAALRSTSARAGSCATSDVRRAREYADGLPRMNFNYVYVAATLLLTVYGQGIVKWRVGEAGVFPAGTRDRVSFLARLVLDPWVLSAFAAAFLAAVSWMAAMT